MMDKMSFKRIRKMVTWSSLVYFPTEEVARFRDHFMEMRLNKNQAEGIDMNADTGDPLRQYARLMQLHYHDKISLDWMLDPRLEDCLTELCGKTPYAVQTMVYFKPAGARGQALHQDQFYLRVQPGTCIAAWMALDNCDDRKWLSGSRAGDAEYPGAVQRRSRPERSFTNDTVVLPEGMAPVPVIMKAGDVLFFNGQFVHGSTPNMSKDRFRRALIGHYIELRLKRLPPGTNPRCASMAQKSKSKRANGAVAAASGSIRKAIPKSNSAAQRCARNTQSTTSTS